MATTTQQILQEVFILAIGRSANADELAWLEARVRDGVDYAGVAREVERYMAQQTAEHGLIGMIRKLAENGLGISLSGAEAQAVVSAALAQGIRTWTDLFAQLVTSTDAVTRPLDNRAEAGNQFLSILADSGRGDLFSGPAANGAVMALVQNIDGSDTGLQSGIAGLQVLADSLSEAGIANRVVDGYIRDATVFADANGNGQLDPGEWSTTTDAEGNYVLPPDTEGTIVAFGGTDIMTGQAFKGRLTAPAGSTQVNPLTTLMDALGANESRTVSESSVLIKTALGLPEGINLLTYDPVARLAEDTADGEALGVLKAVHQVANLMVQLGAVLDAGQTGDGAGGAATALSALASAIATNAGEALDLADVQVLTGIVEDALGRVGDLSAGLPDLAGDVAQVVAAANAAVAAAPDITVLTQALVVAQGDATTALGEGATQGTFDAAIEGFTGDNLEAAISAAEVGLLTEAVPVPGPGPAPMVAWVSSTTPDGTYGTGDTIELTVRFDESVTVNTSGGTPALVLETGNTNRLAEYASGSGTNTLTFSYTVQAGDSADDLDYVTTNSLALNGGTIRDDGGKDADLTLPEPGSADSLGANKALVVDTEGATVIVVSSGTADGTYSAGDTISVTVQFDEAVTVDTTGGTPALTLETGSTDRDAVYASGSGTDTLTFDYTVQAGDTAADLDYTATTALALNGGTIRDGGGNDVDLTLPTPGAAGSLGDNKALVVDAAPPTITAGPAVASATTVSVTSDEDGTAGLYAAGPSLVGSTVALTANTQASLSVAAQGSVETTALTVEDGAGNTTTSGTAVLLGTTGGDTITGGAGPELIFGFAGDDTLTGNGDADTFAVGSGTDTITDYVDGTDVLEVFSGAVANLQEGTTDAQNASNAGTIQFNLSNYTGTSITAHTGSSGADVLNLAAGAGDVDDGADGDLVGIETIDFTPGGNHAFRLDDQSEGFTVNIADSAFSIILQGSSGDDTLNGSASAEDIFDQATGDTDTIRGYGGDDQIALFGGDEVLRFEAPGAGNGVDTIGVTAQGGEAFAPGSGNDILSFSGIGGTGVATDTSYLSYSPGFFSAGVLTGNDAVGDAAALKALLDTSANWDNGFAGTRVVVWEIDTSNVGVAYVEAEADGIDDDDVLVTQVANLTGFADQIAVDAFTSALVASNFEFL